MQKLLMAKGGRKKLSGVEPVEDGDRNAEDDEDEIDSRKGRRSSSTSLSALPMDERVYKPRAYKWRLERKR